MMRFLFISALLFLGLTSSSYAQNSLDLAVNGVGLSVGDSDTITGIRLNFRDDRMKRVNGINATIWMPHKDKGGDVYGYALGLPATGVDNLYGVGYGILGMGANRDIKGLAFGGLGAGAGRDIYGVAVGGLGVGAGRDVVGLMIGGLGAGAGQDLKGIIISGLGAGAGRDITGVVVSGVGGGAGRNFTGVSFSGVASGAGGTLKGVHMAGIAVGATTVRGIILSGFAAGGKDVYAISVAPAYFNVVPGGEMRGLSVSAFNRIQGEQKGVTIGIVNYARKLSGLQLGLINIAKNKDRLSVMPIFNYSN